MPELRRWDVTLKCKGYYGFGGGYAKAKGFSYEDNQIYCSVCPTSSACWEEHKRRTAELIPGLTKEFERRAKEQPQPELMEEWYKEFHTADPYTLVVGGNVEDGMAVVIGGAPKDRGPYTLAWPLEHRT